MAQVKAYFQQPFLLIWKDIKGRHTDVMPGIPIPSSNWLTRSCHQNLYYQVRGQVSKRYNNVSIHDEIYIHVRHGRQGPFRVGPITWLQLDFLGLVGAMTHDISTNKLHLRVPSQQKMKCLDGLILKLTTFTKQWKISTTHTACRKHHACSGG